MARCPSRQAERGGCRDEVGPGSGSGALELRQRKPVGVTAHVGTVIEASQRGQLESSSLEDEVQTSLAGTRG